MRERWHGRLETDSRCSLFVAQPSPDGDPLGAARATLIGDALPVASADLATVREKSTKRIIPIAATIRRRPTTSDVVRKNCGYASRFIFTSRIRPLLSVPMAAWGPSATGRLRKACVAHVPAELIIPCLFRGGNVLCEFPSPVTFGPSRKRSCRCSVRDEDSGVPVTPLRPISEPVVRCPRSHLRIPLRISTLDFGGYSLATLVRSIEEALRPS